MQTVVVGRLTAVHLQPGMHAGEGASIRREGIPTAVVKKTRAAFLDALRQVREANDVAGAEDVAYTEAVARAVSGFLEVVGALNRKHEFLYTLERDEVIDAVDMLAAQLSESARAALDPLLEAALDD